MKTHPRRNQNHSRRRPATANPWVSGATGGGFGPPVLRANDRRGSVLLIVLVIVAVLTLAAYNYTQEMLTDYEATTMFGADVQAREAADSGVEYVATLLGNRTDPNLENLQHNPTLFMGKVITPSTRNRGTVRFTVVAPVEHS